MSVFKSLKGTFQNVQQDIKDGFRALTSLDAPPRHEKLKQLRADGVSLDAGADLLYRYQKDWSDIQRHTVESAKKAEEVDRIVGDIFKKREREWEAACQLEEEAAALPKLASTLRDMVTLIGCLQQDFVAVEQELDRLQNICEEEALEKEKASQMAQLGVYRKKKESDAFALKGKLWGMLKDRAKEAETKKSHAMKDRQEAFMDAFASDMDFYRTHGHPDRLPGGPEFPKVSSLSEMTIEEDKTALDNFLDTEDVHDEELAPEDSFIEDDYTADYGAVDEPSQSFPELDDNRPIDFDDNSNNAVDGVKRSDGKDTSHDSGNDTMSCDSKKTVDSCEAAGHQEESKATAEEGGAEKDLQSESKEHAADT